MLLGFALLLFLVFASVLLMLPVLWGREIRNQYAGSRAVTCPETLRQVGVSLAQGRSVNADIERGRYIPLDVADMLAKFMVNDIPEPALFLKAASDLVLSAGKASKEEHPRVAACGECAPLLWAQGKADAAILLEHLWDEIARAHDLDILCGYRTSGILREEDSQVYERICAEHSAVCAH